MGGKDHFSLLNKCSFLSGTERSGIENDLILGRKSFTKLLLEMEAIFSFLFLNEIPGNLKTLRGPLQVLL